MRLATACIALICGLGACATLPRLTPTPANGRRDAVIEAGGVQLRALPNAWKGYPADVAVQFTPIWIHLVNQSDQAFDITYGAITLIDEAGRLYAAVPPIEVVRTLLGDAAAFDASPRLAQLGFGFGSPYDPWNPASPAYGPYGNPYGPSYASTARSVLVNGFREGRLLPRTQASGFVYFQRAYDAQQLRLHLEAPSEIAGQPALMLETAFSVDR